MSKLIAHGDTKRASEEAVFAVPSPKFTDSWHPYSHSQVLSSVLNAADDFGLEIGRREYSLSADGGKMFGVLQVNNFIESGKLAMTIGVRNSTTKHFAAGICAGTRTFVCDNMAFSSDFVAFRRHTSGMDKEVLYQMAFESFRAVIPQFETLKNWLADLHSVPLGIEQGLLLASAAINAEILPVSKFPHFSELLFSPGSKYEFSLWGFHGAITELYRDNSLLSTQYKNLALNRFLEFEAPLLLAPDTVINLDKRSVSIQSIHEDAVASCSWAEHDPPEPVRND